jgi:hypothetical protein
MNAVSEFFVNNLIAVFFFYGLRESVLPISSILGNDNFIVWFGIPVQLFRAILAVLLTIFGSMMLSPKPERSLRTFWPVALLAAIWLTGTLAAFIAYRLDLSETINVADVLSRYTLGVPGAVIAAWALMVQLRTFRESGMPDYGRDLIWCAAVLALYGLANRSCQSRPYSATTTSSSGLVFLYSSSGPSWPCY